MLVVPLCALLIHPWIESSINDDWSYARSAQILAATGHIVYNGWSTALLGWQLYWGALFIKLFGFSFSILRVSNVVTGSVSALLFYRLLVRCGTGERLALFGTLTLVLSPLYLPLTYSFMTDIGGLFVLFVCFHTCLSCIQARNESRSLAWFVFTAFFGALGGTVRQTSWLPVLVVLPCVLWFFRHRSLRFLAACISALIISFIFIALFLRWYAHQPFTLTESLLTIRVHGSGFIGLVKSYGEAFVDSIFLLLPALALFAVAVPFTRRTAAVYLIGLAPLALCIPILVYHHRLGDWVFPALNGMGDYMTPYGELGGRWLLGQPRVALGMQARLCVTGVCILALLTFAAYLRRNSSLLTNSVPSSAAVPGYVPQRVVNTLFLPFAIVYLLLLVPRASISQFFDRYLLPLVAIALVFLLRRAAEMFHRTPHLRRNAQFIAYPILCVIAFGSVVATHDLFSELQARISAVNALQAEGISPSNIDGGMEYNAWVQVKRNGYVSEPRLVNMQHPEQKPLRASTCAPFMGYLFSTLQAQYALSNDPNLCGGEIKLSPVRYKTWLPPQNGTIYVVRVAK